MRVALYVRVSSTEQAIHGYSIGEQAERLKDYCSAMGWKAYKVYSDAGFTGANTERPALQEMLSEIRKGNIEKVIVYKLDRLSRSQKDTLTLIEDEFLANNCDFVSMSENFDTATPLGRAMVGILSVFAQLEREQIKERTLMGKDARAKEGKWKGGNAPIGYDYIDGELKINEFNAIQVKELFDLFTSGMPVRTIETLFAEKGYKTQYGSKWCTRQIRRTLACPVYIGKIKHRDTLIEGNHEPIIDFETFKSAQDILQSRQKTFADSGIKAGVLNQSTILGGLIWCAQCGARYGKSTSGTRKTGIYYNDTCYSKHKKVKAMIKNPSCKNKSWRIKDLDALVLGEIEKLALDESYFEQITRKPAEDDKREVLQRQIDEIETQISRFLDLYGLGRISVKQLDDKILALEESRDKLKDTLGAIESHQKGLKKEKAMEIIKTFKQALKRANFDEIRGIVTALIDKIEIDGEDITIYWNFS